MDLAGRNKRTFLLAALLFGLTVAAYWSVIQNDFITYDDQEYVVANPHVATGLTWRNVEWAFQARYAANWHPVTWLSHMLDVQLFGLRPGWHHLVNLLFHAANAVLLFVLLLELTGARWRSFGVAALFALHPLHVESVAWIAERKDVLSTFFLFWSVLAYARYTREPRSPAELPVESAADVQRFSFRRLVQSRYYLASLVFCALGLMSKSMLVTLPFILLLLDYWPLGRLRFAGPASNTANTRSLANFWPLLWEKVPYVALAVIASLFTLSAQKLTTFPFGLRAANAVVSYLKYFGLALWPSNLAIFYPHPDLRLVAALPNPPLPASEQWPAWQISAGLLLLLAVSALVVVRRGRQPWLLTGWFWYLGTLVPVIGIIQVGMQAMADRYTYVPLIGLFIAVVWLAAELLGVRRFGRALLVTGSVLVMGACLAGTTRQLSYWRNNSALFQHALAVTTPNGLAHWYVGSDFARQGKFGLAQTHFRAALAADPFRYEAHSALGRLFELDGRTNLALAEYRSTLRIKPADDFAWLRLGGIYRNLNQPGQAQDCYTQALRANSESVEANYELGTLLLDRGDLPAAAKYINRAVELKPDHADALLCLSDLRLREGKPAEAEAAFRRVVHLYPTNFELRVNLGGMLWEQGKLDAARTEYREALRLKPEHPMAHYNLGTVLTAQDLLPEATAEFAEASRLKPDYAEALIEWGRLLALQGKTNEAIPPLDRAFRLHSTNAPLCANLGAAWLLAQRPNEAAMAFSEAARLQPDLGQRLLNQSRDQAQQGHLSAAVRSAEKARNLALAAQDQDLVRAADAMLLMYKKASPQPAAQ